MQTRGNVNKGIRLTILKEPEKFFAYNNGLTCTAKSIVFKNNIISEIVGLQIVNGGQTTASLANVLVNEKGGAEKLQEVSVPMKLNVIKNVQIEDELVPAISRYANSQNKVSDVDLASNHPFHKKLKNFLEKFLRLRQMAFLMEPIGIMKEQQDNMHKKHIKCPRDKEIIS